MPPMSSAITQLRPLLPFLGRYRARLAVGLTLVVISSALSSVVPWLLRAAIDGLRAGAPPSRAWRIAAGMVALALGAGVLRFYMREILNGVSRRVEFDLRNALFVHLTSLDESYFARTRTGDLMARLTNDLNAVRMAAGPAIMYLVNTIAGGAFALVFMLRIDVRLTALALLPMILLPFVMVRLGRLVHDRFEAVQEHFSDLTTRVQENLSGARIVRAYRQEAAEEARFAALNDEYLRRNVSLAHLNGIMNPSFGLLAGTGSAVVLGVGGTLAVQGTITVGAFVAFGFYLAILTWPMIALGWVINLFQRGAASMARLTQILEARSSLPQAAAPRRLPTAAAGRSIEFRGVSFHYPASGGGEPRWVLRDVSFVVPAGATLGVVGATGSGKSALIDLIPRMYDPQAGEILLDGIPLGDLDLGALRREIGYVPQESLLFSETIASNIAYGASDALDLEDDAGAARAASDASSTRAAAEEPAATLAGAEDGGGGATPESAAQLAGRDAVSWAAGVAQLDETVRGFPGGYETVLGERGINLSGGQKQRAALARALARRPSLVLLDDSLSAVDTHTEAEILRGLRGALAERTTVIASHRISAIRDATWIIVLDGGRIVEQGRHEELLALGGRYDALLRRQQLEESIDGAAPGGPEGDAGHRGALAVASPVHTLPG
jgi:ATP-binding cassette subfamily B multidrug efflux pump